MHTCLIKDTNTTVADPNASNTHIKVIFQNCEPFGNCINEINNKQIDNIKDIDVVIMAM